MSTHAIFTFKDADGSFAVFKHWDGYPSEALKCIRSALSKAWLLPRFEADEFAAAFVAANKDGSGDIRFINVGDNLFAYNYMITVENGNLMVEIRNGRGKLVDKGTLDELCVKKYD